MKVNGGKRKEQGQRDRVRTAERTERARTVAQEPARRSKTGRSGGSAMPDRSDSPSVEVSEKTCYGRQRNARRIAESPGLRPANTRIARPYINAGAMYLTSSQPPPTSHTNRSNESTKGLGARLFELFDTGLGSQSGHGHRQQKSVQRMDERHGRLP